MERHFNVVQNKNVLTIEDKTSLPLSLCDYWIYIDNQLVASFHAGNTFYVHHKASHQSQHMLIVAAHVVHGIPYTIAEQFVIMPTNNGDREPNRNFKAGDILVASDNLNKKLTGYVGHSAIVVDDSHLIESPGGHPAIQKDSIQQFLDKHPTHAQFRPKSADLGKKAVEYAEKYYAKYQKNLEEGKAEPEFSFMESQSLEDPWKYIYCSKLVWLSYYKGADYKLENDYLWYSPEDLYTNLKKNDDFKTIYENEDVKFDLDT
ncbi:hypothetical protein [Radiobacillus sp. PE A8.2]|uniref:hypothetical protein n=1 Tax=Radiobacillus sp. PE A8.2 TaxID=3380349 RepID=UPI00388FC1F8